MTPPPPGPVTIDTTAVFRALGTSGRAQGAVASVSFILVEEAVRLGADTLLAALAYGSPINIQQVSGHRAVTTGDFAILAPQVPALLRALTTNGITPTAVHSHLVGESPTVTYVHFWGDGPLDQLLRGLRAAVDAAR